LGKYIVIVLGGGMGSLARYLLGTAVMNRFGGKFPLGTLIINVTGSFAIGVLMTLFTERLQPHPYWRLILVIGFLGGYTTFSSFEYESLQAVREGGLIPGLLNMAGSVALGFVAVWAGAVLAARR
jgi:CrcB protein